MEKGEITIKSIICTKPMTWLFRHVYFMEYMGGDITENG